jgi:hypothetical protein
LLRKLLPLVILLMGCSGSSGGGDAGVGGFSVTQKQINYNTKVDFLWVLDTSTDMSGLHGQIAGAMDAFFSQLVTLRLDYRVAAITMDNANFIGNPKVITTSTWNLEEAFSLMVQPRVNSSAHTRAYDMLSSALSESLLNGANKNFLRSDALLVIIFAGKRVDQSQQSISNTIAFLNRLKPRQWIAHALNFGSIYSYQEIVNYAEGYSHIAQGNVMDGVAEIRKSTLDVLTSLPLDILPSGENLEVIVNGRLHEAWYHHMDSNSIRFFNDFIPASDSIIKVKYSL